MSGEFIAVITLLLPALGIFFISRSGRKAGQEILETGFLPERSFLNLFPARDVSTSQIWGYLYKVGGLLGYLFAASLVLQALAVVFFGLDALA